jgi:hypothetical protein
LPLGPQRPVMGTGNSTGVFPPSVTYTRSSGAALASSTIETTACSWKKDKMLDRR